MEDVRPDQASGKGEPSLGLTSISSRSSDRDVPRHVAVWIALRRELTDRAAAALRFGRRQLHRQRHYDINLSRQSLKPSFRSWTVGKRASES